MKGRKHDHPGGNSLSPGTTSGTPTDVLKNATVGVVDVRSTRKGTGSRTRRPGRTDVETLKRTGRTVTDKWKSTNPKGGGTWESWEGESHPSTRLPFISLSLHLVGNIVSDVCHTSRSLSPSVPFGIFRVTLLSLRFMFISVFENTRPCALINED